MGSVTRFVLPGAVLAAAAVAGVLLLGRADSSARATPSAPLLVRASFDSPRVAFGDRLTARVTVLVDRSLVRPDTLRLSDDLAPLTEVGPARTTETTHGRLTAVSVETTAACLTDPCVARSGDTPLRLPRVTVRVESRDSRVLRADARWPTLHVGSRVSSDDLARLRPRFVADTAPPAPGYAVAPSTLAAVLDALAAVLAAACVVLTVGLIVRRRTGAAPAAGELETALRLAREAESRPPADRRRALQLLARRLDARQQRLAGAARDLAWSEPPPERQDVSRLVAEVEREVTS
jgi:hypothetical protein